MAVTKTSYEKKQLTRARNRETAYRPTRLMSPELIKEKWAWEEKNPETPWIHPDDREVKVVTPTQASQLDPVVAQVIQPIAKTIVGAGGASFSTDPSARGMKDKLHELLQKAGVEPADELIKIATQKDDAGHFMCSQEDRIAIWSKLMEYRMPKLKSVEHSGGVEHNLTVVVKKFGSLEETPIKKLKAEG